MSYRYECRACRTVSKTDTEPQAEQVRDLHRAVHHGGMAPMAGDQVRPSRIPVPQGPPPISGRRALLLLGLLVAALLATRLLSH